MAEPHPTVKAAFIDRAKAVPHPLSSYLLRLMDLKASNLCLSADVTSARELLVLADRVGPSIVVLKTHHDIVSGWDYNPGTGTGARLATLARKHGFLIFEDRKFGDIGNTVQMQYTSGAGRIIEWAHMVTVNMVPGPAVVTALADAAARWTERWPYEVRTLVSVGTPKANNFDDGDDEKNGEGEGDRSPNSTGNHDGGDDKLTVSGGGGGGSGGEMDPNQPAGSKVNSGNGRKGSIVSITTVTQHYEPAPSPRGSSLATKGDEELFQGIEEAPIDRGLLILAQMSSTGNFMGPDYTRACVEAARLHRRFVMGFVSQQSLNSAPDDTFIHMTPGCQIPPEEEQTGGGGNDSVGGGDGKGQNYNTPQRLVEGCGADIVIVGRGILHAANQQSEAERYRREAWRAYLSRTHDSRPEDGGGCPA